MALMNLPLILREPEESVLRFTFLGKEVERLCMGVRYNFLPNVHAYRPCTRTLCSVVSTRSSALTGKMYTSYFCPICAFINGFDNLCTPVYYRNKIIKEILVKQVDVNIALIIYEYAKHIILF